MGYFFLEDILKPGESIGDHSAGLFCLEGINLLFIVFYLLIHIFELFFDDITWRFMRNELVLFFDIGFFLLFFKHFVYFEDLEFQFPISLLQLLYVFDSKWVGNGTLYLLIVFIFLVGSFCLSGVSPKTHFILLSFLLKLFTNYHTVHIISSFFLSPLMLFPSQVMFLNKKIHKVKVVNFFFALVLK